MGKLKEKIDNIHGITLVALVVTIVILLILSGVTISALTGDNGIIKQSKLETKQTSEKVAKEEIEKIVLEYDLTEENQTLEEFLKTKVPEKIDSVINNGDGTLTIEKNGYTVTVDDVGGNAKITIGDIIVSTNSDGTGAVEEASSVDVGETLYISFSHSIQGGTTTVSPSLPYAVSKNGTYKFIVTGTVNGKEYRKNVTVSVNQFDNTNYNIYAFLYEDGTLSFGNTDEVISGKTITKQYGNIKDSYYNIEKDSSGSIIADTPWFNDESSIKKVSILNTIYPKSTSKWFMKCTNLLSIDGIERLNTSHVTDMSYMFYNCTSLTSLDLSDFDTSNVTNMSYMFSGDDANKINLTEIIGLKNFNTSKVTTMRAMFNNCVELTSLDLSSFDTSNVTDMTYMFCGGTSNKMSLTEIKGLENFNTSKVTSMGSMFYNCVNLTNLNLSSFNTSNVTYMRVMFYNCENLTSIDLSNFDTSNVTNMRSMFSGCTNLARVDLSSFNTSKVTTMRAMFNNCKNLTELDLSGFDTSNVTDMAFMFYGTTNMKNIYVSSKWTMANVTTNSSMYSGSGVSTTTLKN